MKRYLVTYQIPFKRGGGQVIGHAFVTLERLTQSALEECAKTITESTAKENPSPQLAGLQWQSVVPLEG